MEGRTLGDERATIPQLMGGLLPSSHTSRESWQDEIRATDKRKKSRQLRKTKMNWQCTMSVASCIDASGPVLFVHY